MLLLMKTGEAESRSGAARYLGVHRHTIADWLELYEEGGIEKIQEVKFRRLRIPGRIPASSRFHRA
jgi:transposase